MCDPIIVRFRSDLAVPCEADIDPSGHLVIDVHTGLRRVHMVDLVAQLIGDPCVLCGLSPHRRAVEVLHAATAVPLADTA